jgi:carbamoyltransferase
MNKISKSSNNVYIWFNNLLTNHDFSITIIYNGKIKAIEIERINRLKYSPHEYKLKKCSFNENIINVDEYFKDILQYILKDLKISSTSNIYIINSPTKILRLEEKNNFISYTCFLNHHYTHAISAFFPSQFKNAAIVCIDWSWYEDRLWILLCQSIRVWKWDKINFIEWNIYDKSNQWIWRVYSLISGFIWFEPWTTMWLSWYWTPERFNNINLYEYQEKNVILNKKFLKNTENINVWKDNYPLNDDEFIEIINNNIKKIFWVTDKDNIQKEIDITKSIFADIAAKLQKDTEDAIVFLANQAYRATKSKNICLAWWVALNVLANTNIIERTPFENIFIQPAAKDSGLSLGAAYYAYHYLWKQKKRIPLVSAWLGNIYNENEIINSLNKYKDYISFYKVKDIAKITAEKLAENKIIWWFSWWSEFWPRALWFRSILASPIKIEMKDSVNDIKNRQRWRPLAPILLEEDLQTYFETNTPSGYMTLVWKIKKEKIEKVPSILHVDETARYQTVNKKQNSKMHKLLIEFKKITWESILLNTSFNNNREPIVETPEDAIKMFLSSKIDYLIIENFIVSKEKLQTNRFCFNYEETLTNNKKRIFYKYEETKEEKIISKFKILLIKMFEIKNHIIVNIRIKNSIIEIYYDDIFSISIFLCNNYSKYYHKEWDIALSINLNDFEQKIEDIKLVDMVKKKFILNNKVIKKIIQNL